MKQKKSDLILNKLGSIETKISSIEAQVQENARGIQENARGIQENAKGIASVSERLAYFEGKYNQKERIADWLSKLIFLLIGGGIALLGRYIIP